MAVIGMKDKLVRFSFASVWEPRAMNPGDAPKYGVQVLIPKEHKDTVDQVRKLIDAAIKAGIAKGTVTQAMVNNSNFKKCLRDGDEEAAMGDNKEYLKGHWFLNANAAADRQPGVVDKFAQPIMRKDDFYSGCYGIVDIGFFTYKNQGMGVAAGLNSIMKREDGDRLDGRVPPEQAFADLKDDIAEEGELQ